MSARPARDVATDHDSSPAQLGWQAAEAIRTLNHLTGRSALTDPAEIYELLAALATMAYRLPQLLGQLSRWLQAEHAAGRLHVDTDDPTEVTAAATGALTRAGRAANSLADAIDTSQQQIAHISAGAGS